MGPALLRLDRRWTSVEQYLAVFAIVAEIVTLVFWVALRAMASSYEESHSPIGPLFRGILGAIILGLIAHLILRPKPGQDQRLIHPVATTVAVFVGLVLGWAWTEFGVSWSSNAVGWLQNASSVALIGGPRGAVTRLTLWLALLGASMAASRGKHISIDVATRYFPERLIPIVAIVGYLVAAVVCFAAAWGFVDSIGVTKFRAEAFRPCAAGEESESGICETTRGERLAVISRGVGNDLFLLGRQISLDFKTIPKVLTGDPYNNYLSAPEWNAWIREGGWTDRYPEADVKAILMPEEDPKATKMPLIVEPGTGSGAGLLIRDLNFILPFGLLVIGLKMLLRILLVATGQVKIDPDAIHDEEGLTHGHDSVATGGERPAQ